MESSAQSVELNYLQKYVRRNSCISWTLNSGPANVSRDLGTVPNSEPQMSDMGAKDNVCIEMTENEVLNSPAASSCAFCAMR